MCGRPDLEMGLGIKHGTLYMLNKFLMNWATSPDQLPYHFRIDSEAPVALGDYFPGTHFLQNISHQLCREESMLLFRTLKGLR